MIPSLSTGCSSGCWRRSPRLRTWQQRSGDARYRFFEHLRTITAHILFPYWKSLMAAIANHDCPFEFFRSLKLNPSHERSLARVHFGSFQLGIR